MAQETSSTSLGPFSSLSLLVISLSLLSPRRWCPLSLFPPARRFLVIVPLSSFPVVTLPHTLGAEARSGDVTPGAGFGHGVPRGGYYCYKLKHLKSI
jgi:predicted dienelactone hydrolase